MLVMLLWGVALAAGRPAERVPSASRAGETAPVQTTSTSTNVNPPAMVPAATVPPALVAGPECLGVSAVSKTSESDASAVTLILGTTLVNTCGQPVLAYAGRLEFSSTRGTISQAIGIYSTGGVPAQGGSATWRFGVQATVEDIWLNAAPTASMSWTWTTATVLLADGTVYRGEVVLPDARRGR